MDAIFKALNDPHRRALLDSLRQKDGQTLSELEGQLEMTRFGVMKHLKLLEEASLVTTRKVGRFKYHYLNAVPLQEVIDRWIEPLLAKPQARAVLDLKAALETEMSKPDVVLSTYINTTHDRLWEALTKGDLISKYHFACDRVTGDYADGQTVDYIRPDGSSMLSNRVIRVDPKSRIEMEFAAHWAGDAPVSRCVYLVEPSGQQMRLTVEHYDVPDALQGVSDGWARFFAGLKTFVETGESVRYTYEEAGA